MQLSFDVSQDYDVGKPGILVPVILQSGERRASFDAKLDTRATHCVFQRLYGEALDLPIEGGYERSFNTVTGSFIAFGHEVTMFVAGFQFDVMVYFAKDYNFSKNLLGRRGFLGLVRLGLIDYEGKLFLSRYPV
jgi:hypothetical protein